jgi:hypothetical protein
MKPIICRKHRGYVLKAKPVSLNWSRIYHPSSTLKLLDRSVADLDSAKFKLQANPVPELDPVAPFGVDVGINGLSLDFRPFLASCKKSYYSIANF